MCESINGFSRIKFSIEILDSDFLDKIHPRCAAELPQIYTEIYPFALGTWITPCINVGGGCNAARCLVQPQKHLITVSLIELTDLSTPSSLTPIMPSG